MSLHNSSLFVRHVHGESRSGRIQADKEVFLFVAQTAYLAQVRYEKGSKFLKFSAYNVNAKSWHNFKLTLVFLPLSSWWNRPASYKRVLRSFFYCYSPKRSELDFIFITGFTQINMKNLYHRRLPKMLQAIRVIVLTIFQCLWPSLFLKSNRLLVFKIKCFSPCQSHLSPFPFLHSIR